MLRLVFTVVLWNTITTQPVVDDTKKNREPRQIDFRECCPCPSKLNRQDTMGGQSILDQMSASIGSERSSLLDDCPCRLRDVDSEGSSSVFFPSAMHPVRPIVRAEDTKEDPKPLLHPEVDLASSVLETLREVTDEEYQNALARDAARNEARVSELRDFVPETSKNVLTIIVNPKESEEDTTPEASQAQETHVLPLDLSRSDPGNEGEHRVPVFRIQPSLNRNFDMDSGASNIQERTVGLNKGLEGLRLKTSPSVLKLLSTKKPEAGNIQSLLKLRNRDKALANGAKEVTKTSVSKLGPKIPSLKFPSLFKNNNNGSLVKPLNTLKKIDILKLRSSTKRPKVGSVDVDMDSNTSPSVIQEQFAEAIDSREITKFKSVLPTQVTAKIPFSVKKLLNLKNVELIPPKPIHPLALPGLKLLPPLRINTLGTNFVKQRNRIGSKSKKDCYQKDMEIIDTNTQVIQKDGTVITKILDVVPSPSENIPIIEDLETNTDTQNTNQPETSKIQKIKTDIIDKLPRPSENSPVVITNENNVDKAEVVKSNTQVPKYKIEKTEILDTITSASENNEFATSINDNDMTTALEEDSIIDDIKEDIKSLNSGEAQTVGFNRKKSKDNKQNIAIDEDDIELDIEEDGDEETEFVEENKEPIREIQISDVSSDEESQGVNFEIPNNSEISFNTDDIESIIIEDEDSVNQDIELTPEPLSPIGNADESSELFKKESMENSDDDQDAIAKTSNQEIKMAPLENIEQRGDIFSEHELEATDESFQDDKQLELNSQPMASTFSSAIKERISLKLNTLKNPDTKILTISRLVKPEISQSNFKHNEKSSLNSDESTNIDSLSEDTEQFILHEKTADPDDIESDINIKDLQKLSNNLLNMSGKQEQQTRGSEIANFFNENANDRNDEIITNSDMESSRTSNFEFFGTSNENVSLRTTQANDDVIDFDKGEDLGDGTVDDKNQVNNCPAGLKVTNAVVEKNTENAATDTTDNGFNEMALEASDSVLRTVPLAKPLKSYSSPLLRQTVLEPSSLFDTSSLFNPVLPLNLPNLNVQLPSLDIFQPGISNLLETNQRASEVEDISSNEYDALDDCTNVDPVMATDASTTSSKSSVFNPFEDVNLDILQINPLSQASPMLPKIPSLNLNTFKTKLALPKAFDLKPLKLQSSLGGKNGGLIGASLTFGPKRIKGARTLRPKTTLGSILNRQENNILGNPLTKVPSLEELGSTMRANAKSLFDSPIVKHINGPIEDTLHTTQTLTNSLRSHTDNTMHNLQKTLTSTMNEARQNSINNVGHKFARPQDILEHLSSAHEDMNDKLYAIHVDLKDRLDSIHDRITEETNLPKLQSPLLNTFARSDDNPLSRTDKIGGWVPKSPAKTSSKKSGAKVRNSVPKGKFTIRSKTNDQTKLKPFKMSKAASSLTPKRVEVPKLQTTSSRPPFSKPLHRDDRVQLKETRPFFTDDKTLNAKSAARSQFKPFGDFKISIASTPPPTSLRTKHTIKTPIESKSSVLMTDQPTRPSGQSRFTDSRGFASELKTSRTPIPTSLGASKKNFGNNVLPKPRSSSISSRPKFVTDKSSIDSPLNSPTPYKSTSLRPTLKGISTSLSLPKTTESPLLAKMRDAIRIKFSNHPAHLPDTLRNKETVNNNNRDMARSASENNEVIIRSEPMKENISYKCKMVCVRE